MNSKDQFVQFIDKPSAKIDLRADLHFILRIDPCARESSATRTDQVFVQLQATIRMASRTAKASAAYAIQPDRKLPVCCLNGHGTRHGPSMPVLDGTAGIEGEIELRVGLLGEWKTRDAVEQGAAVLAGKDAIRIETIAALLHAAAIFDLPPGKRAVVT